MSATLDRDELIRLTGYVQPARQVRELQRQGFSRARRNRLGEVVLERAHYDAVCAGEVVKPRPRVRQPMKANP